MSLLQPSISQQKLVPQSQLHTSNSKPHVLNFVLCFQMFTLYDICFVWEGFEDNETDLFHSLNFKSLLFVYIFTLLDVSAVRSVSSLGEVSWEILKKKKKEGSSDMLTIRTRALYLASRGLSKGLWKDSKGLS